MRTLFISVALLFCARSFTQSNTFFVELGGNAQGFSINYERQLTKEKGLMISLGAGGAFVEEDKEPGPFNINFGISEPKLSIPLAVRYLFKIKNENYIESGLGYTWINVNKNFVSTERGKHNLIAELGFRRYFGKQDDWIWRVNFSPIFAGNGISGFTTGFSPTAGISVGKRF